MRKLLRIILRILDGSPTTQMSTRNRQRGQSMLEMAFITPLLAILVAGAVEVGWYANRWLTILEVTRVGARSATFLQGSLSPLEWNNDASVNPNITSQIALEAPDAIASTWRQCGFAETQGFYPFIVCIVESSLSPLTMRFDLNDPLDADDAATEGGETDPITYDDIVVSVFSIQNVNNAVQTGHEANNEGEPNGRPTYVDYQSIPQSIDPVSGVYKITYDLNGTGGFGGSATEREYPPGLQNIVIGRFPSNANECTHNGTSNADKQLMTSADPGYEPDPFDYLSSDNGAVTKRTYGTTEFTEYTFELADTNGDPLSDTAPEFQRGFSYVAQHRISDPNVFCYGSEFSTRDVEELINMPGFIGPNLYDGPDSAAPEWQDWVDDEVYPSQDERMFFEPQGMTLVEVFWQHNLLLRFPLFRPILDTFGDEDEIVIALWSAFPLPTTAPNITYQLP